MLKERLSALWKAREDRARSHVGHLIERLGLTAAPIPLAPIASVCRVQRVVFRPMLGSGATVPTDTGFTMYVNCKSEDVNDWDARFNDQSDQGRFLPNRARFTVAHEIAHTLFYDWSASVGTSLVPIRHHKALNSLERTCNRVAGSLLLPEHLLWQEISELRTFEADQLVGVARKFRVSLETLILRLDSLPYLPNSDSGVALAAGCGPNLMITRKTASGRIAPLLRLAEGASLPTFLASDPRLLVNGGSVRSISLSPRSTSGSTEKYVVTFARVGTTARPRFLIAAELRA